MNGNVLPDKINSEHIRIIIGNLSYKVGIQKIEFQCLDGGRLPKKVKSGLQIRVTEEMKILYGWGRVYN